MAKKQSSTLKSTHWEAECCEDFDTPLSQATIADISSDQLEQIMEIIQLKGSGVKPKQICAALNISERTYYRRIEQIRKMRGANPIQAKEAVLEHIGETIAFYKMMIAEGLQLAGLTDDILGAPTSKEKKKSNAAVKGLRIAMDAQRQMQSFLHSVGFFETYKAEQNAKAYKIVHDSIFKELNELYLLALDDNHMLRENLEAARNGEVEPHSEDKFNQWPEHLTDKYDGRNGSDFEKQPTPMLH